MGDDTNQAARVLAERLREAMRARGETQASLARKSGVAQTTISLYLRPENRGESATGKDKGATLPRVEMLAGALGMQPWELLMPSLVYEQFKTLQKLQELIVDAAPTTSVSAAAPAATSSKRRAA